jgi:hypothetical protein
MVGLRHSGSSLCFLRIMNLRSRGEKQQLKCGPRREPRARDGEDEREWLQLEAWPGLGTPSRAW